MTAAPQTHRPRHCRRGAACVLPALALMLPLAASAHTHARHPRAAHTRAAHTRAAPPRTARTDAATDQPRVLLASYRTVRPHRPRASAGTLQVGIASWYGEARRGFRTASGSVFDPDAMTAASHTLPLGTRVLVTIAGTARSVLVTITDRMQTAHRLIDLSMGAARQIGMLAQGTARVTLRRV